MITPKKASDRFPSNAKMFAEEATMGGRRFEYLVARRDQLFDRLRFGAMSINGASLVGLMGALGGDGHAAAWLGFNPPRARMSAIAFAIGVIAAGVSVLFERYRLTMEPADGFKRYLSAVTLAALHEAPETPEIIKKIGEAMESHHKLPLVDFQYSRSALVLQNVAMAAWLYGIGVPLAASLW